MKISVPATSANLGPGFDTLGLALDLRSEAIIEESNTFSVTLKGEGENNPKIRGNNMFVGIFNEIYEKITEEKKTFKFKFINRIPLSRGLGSSSSVIVSAIVSAHAAAKVKVSKQTVLNMALFYEPHPDNITPAVMGGFNVAFLQNKKVNFIKQDMPNDLVAVVVIPDKKISTFNSRKTLPNKYKKSDVIFNVSHSSFLTAAFLKQDWKLLKEASRDRLHQYYRMMQIPELFTVQKIAYKNGALMSVLSGSGSTFMNITTRDNAKNLAKRLQDRFPTFRVLQLDFDNSGSIVHS